jgi:hypothetical protein
MVLFARVWENHDFLSMQFFNRKILNNIILFKFPFSTGSARRGEEN